MVSMATTKANSVSGNRVPERSGAELDVSTSTWPVDFPLGVLRTVEGAGATVTIDLASLWSSRAEAEQSGRTVKLSPEHAVFIGQLWSITRCMVARSAIILPSLSSPVCAAAN